MLVFWSYFKDLIPLLATIPLAVAAIWIGNRWLRLPRGDAELRVELAALRDEVDTLRQQQAETQERLDFAERLLNRLRDAHVELPKSS